jgi:hypothetical protein
MVKWGLGEPERRPIEVPGTMKGRRMVDLGRVAES